MNSDGFLKKLESRFRRIERHHVASIEHNIVGEIQAASLEAQQTTITAAQPPWLFGRLVEAIDCLQRLEPCVRAERGDDQIELSVVDDHLQLRMRQEEIVQLLHHRTHKVAAQLAEHRPRMAAPEDVRRSSGKKIG